jgi:hypothetical protein
LHILILLVLFVLVVPAYHGYKGTFENHYAAHCGERYPNGAHSHRAHRGTQSDHLHDAKSKVTSQAE